MRGGIRLADQRELCGRMEVHDERIVERAALRAKNLPAGAGVERVGGKPVDRFRRDRDEVAGAKPSREEGELAGGAAIDAGDGGFCHGTKKAGGLLRPEKRRMGDPLTARAADSASA